MKKQKEKAAASSAKPSSLRGWKLWCFRAVALIGAPLVFLCVVELVLRVADYGYPTSFLLPSSHNGQPVFVQNNQFGWRFFGPEMARLPHPFSIAQSKPHDTIRIFVLGESAAKGDPDPNFGLSRMLETLLSLRHPGIRFEVINTAMTAINSHAILPIARDCAHADGDIWVLYMGNNEVVGPFGAGTVFGPQTPPLPLVRGALAFKSTRTGQLLESVLQRAQKSSSKKSEWGGMEMFLEQQVRADDARMSGVYHHFESNLADILRIGQHAGVGIVVSTVAVNLKDNAPFASVHRRDVSSDGLAKWNETYQLGIKAQDAGRLQEAAEHFAEAARLDDTFAELRFRQGQCALALDKSSDAQQSFQAARDLDALRFRCDTRLNGITRQAATNRESQRIMLADVEKVFAEQSAAKLPGENFFYEHVHLNLEGNWLLARTIGEQVEVLLGDRLAQRTGDLSSWPTVEDCARRLGWSDWSQLAAWKGILPRLNKPPFTGQFNHESQMQRVQSTLALLASATQPSGISNALQTLSAALVGNPDDWALLRQLTAIRKAAGNLDGAARMARRAVELLPSDAEGWAELGLILARQREFADAVAAFRRAVELNPQDVMARESMAQSLAALGQREEAVSEFRRVLDMKPQLGLVWLHQGQLLEQMGRKTEAETCFEKAKANPGQNPDALAELAGFFQQRGAFDSAAELYVKAIAFDPANAKLHVGAGQNFSALKRLTEAAHHSAEAIRFSPEFAEAHLLHGTILGRQGNLAGATEQFREAVRLKPGLLDARVNLGIALAGQNPAEALAQFEEVLKQSPTNVAALKYSQQLRAKLR